MLTYTNLRIASQNAKLMQVTAKYDDGREMELIVNRQSDHPERLKHLQDAIDRGEVISGYVQPTPPPRPLDPLTIDDFLELYGHFTEPEVRIVEKVVEKIVEVQVAPVVEEDPEVDTLRRDFILADETEDAAITRLAEEFKNLRSKYVGNLLMDDGELARFHKLNTKAGQTWLRL